MFSQKSSGSLQSLPRTLEGKLFVTAPDGSAFRIFLAIPDTFSYEYGEQTEESMEECGRIFGEFRPLLFTGLDVRQQKIGRAMK